MSGEVGNHPGEHGDRPRTTWHDWVVVAAAIVVAVPIGMLLERIDRRRKKWWRR